MLQLLGILLYTKHFNNFTDEELLDLFKKCITLINSSQSLLKEFIYFILQEMVRREISTITISKEFIFNKKTENYIYLKDFKILKLFFKVRDFFSISILKEIYEKEYEEEQKIYAEYSKLDKKIFGDLSSLFPKPKLWIDILCSIKNEVSENAVWDFTNFQNTLSVIENINNPFFIQDRFNYDSYRHFNFENFDINNAIDQSNFNDYFNKIKKDYKNIKLVVLNTKNVCEITEYIRENFKLKNENSIKDFLEYINNYECAKEIEDIFIDQIIELVNQELKDNYSLINYLEYFDGKIIFNNEKNNKLYDDLRVELLENNKVLKILIDEILFFLPEEEKKLYLRYHNSYRDEKLICNRSYYSSNSTSWKFLAKYIPEFTKSTIDFKKGLKVKEALIYFKNVIDQKILETPYNYTLINIPASTEEKTIARFHLIMGLLCLLTGLKNGFRVISLIENKIITSKKEGGRGILEKVNFNKVKTKYAILIDDVYTTGETIKTCEKLLKNKNKNLQVPLYITFALTRTCINPNEYFLYSNNDKILVILFVKYEYKNYYEFEYFFDEKEIYKASEYVRKRLLIEKIPEKYMKYNNKYYFHFFNKNGLVYSTEF